MLCIYTLRRLFPSDAQLTSAIANTQNKRIYSIASLRVFERDTVDIWVEMTVEK